MGTKQQLSQLSPHTTYSMVALPAIHLTRYGKHMLQAHKPPHTELSASVVHHQHDAVAPHNTTTCPTPAHHHTLHFAPQQSRATTRPLAGNQGPTGQQDGDTETMLLRAAKPRASNKHYQQQLKMDRRMHTCTRCMARHTTTPQATHDTAHSTLHVFIPCTHMYGC